MSLLHLVKDGDPEFFIDPVTRAITTIDKEKIILVKGDRNSESYTFAVPRTIEGHDMKECNKVRVHFINTDAVTMQTSPGIFELDGLLELYTPEGKDEEYVIFTWLIDSPATTYAGKLAFAIEYACFNGADKVYSWNTLPYSNITVSDGINNVTVIEAQYKDILQEWYDKIYGSSELPIKFVTQAEYDALGNNYETNTLYMITDDTTLESFKAEVRNLTTGFDDKIKALENSQVSVKDVNYEGDIGLHDVLPTSRGINFETRIKTLEDDKIATPTKTSELTNDSGFITSSDVPTNTSELTNDSGFITLNDIPSMPHSEKSDIAKTLGEGKHYYIKSGSGASTSSGIASLDIPKSDDDWTGIYLVTVQSTLGGMNMAFVPVGNGTYRTHEIQSVYQNRPGGTVYFKYYIRTMGNYSDDYASIDLIAEEDFDAGTAIALDMSAIARIDAYKILDGDLFGHFSSMNGG